MKSQLLKGMTMLTLIVVVAFAAAVVSTKGQSTNRVMSHIPFEFVVGDQTLPAGEYTIGSRTADGGVLVIDNEESRRSMVRLASMIQPKRNQIEAKLVFHRYGQNYFLTEVWTGADTIGRKLLESKQERSLRRELKALAQNTSYETVELVATLR